MIAVLDHGYVKLISHLGSDQEIVEDARMSTDKGFRGWGPKWICTACEAHISEANKQPTALCVFCGCYAVEAKKGDEGLLSHLYNSKPQHSSPFEGGVIKVEVQAPIFVFREWHRHRTQSYSEMSARYTPLPDLNYIPSIDRLMMNQEGSNKQANRADGAEPLTEQSAAVYQMMLERAYKDAQTLYENSLKWGVPKELARVHLPVGRYSRMRATANLRNWLHFLTLRLHPTAQWEIRQYAEAVANIIQVLFPRTYQLFDETRPR